jgi:hypothetical protein
MLNKAWDTGRQAPHRLQVSSACSDTCKRARGAAVPGTVFSGIDCGTGLKTTLLTLCQEAHTRLAEL